MEKTYVMGSGQRVPGGVGGITICLKPLGMVTSEQSPKEGEEAS